MRLNQKMAVGSIQILK